jgi:site-specific recombinase XerD
LGRKSNIPRIEKRFGQPISQILEDLYSKGNLKFVANILGISLGSAYNYIKKSGIERQSKTKSDSIQGELVDLIQDFLISKEIGGKTKATLDFYRSNLHRFLWWLENQHISTTLKSFDSTTIRQFLHYLKTQKHRFGNKSISPSRLVSRSTVDAYWRTFQSFGSWLVNQGKLRASPIKQVEKPGQSKVVVPDIPKNTIIAMLDKCNESFTGRRNKAILLVFLDTGIRLSEMSQIKIQDLDMTTGLIKVMGKGQKERIVRISPITREILSAYLKIRQGKSTFLWENEYGKSLGKHGIKNMIRKFKAMNPNIKISPHVFRHTFAVNLLRAGGDIYSLQTLGGWEDLAMPKMYSQSVQQEHALKVHKKASPVDFIFANTYVS